MMRKLLAYFDKATVLLYFAQSVFLGENKHKLNEEKNHNGKSIREIYGLYGQYTVYGMALG